MNWVKFNNDNTPTDNNNMPGEGEPVLTTDGYSYTVLCFIMSGTYEWQPMLEGYVTPFIPTHWQPLPDLPLVKYKGE